MGANEEDAGQNCEKFVPCFSRDFLTFCRNRVSRTEEKKMSNFPRKRLSRLYEFDPDGAFVYKRFQNRFAGRFYETPIEPVPRRRLTQTPYNGVKRNFETASSNLKVRACGQLRLS
jgi:hypothetical protein